MTFGDRLSIEREWAKKAIDSGKFLSEECSSEKLTSELLNLVIDAFIMPFEELMTNKQNNSDE